MTTRQRLRRLERNTAHDTELLDMDLRLATLVAETMIAEGVDPTFDSAGRCLLTNGDQWDVVLDMVKRIDSDDLVVPEGLVLHVDYTDQHQTVTVVAKAASSATKQHRSRGGDLRR